MLVHGVIRRHGCYLPITMYTNSISSIYSLQVTNVASVIVREIYHNESKCVRRVIGLIGATVIPSYSIVGTSFEYRKAPRNL